MTAGFADVARVFRVVDDPRISFRLALDVFRMPEHGEYDGGLIRIAVCFVGIDIDRFAFGLTARRNRDGHLIVFGSCMRVPWL